MPISKIPVGAIQSGAIATTQIADNAVTTAKILDDNVTSAKIPNDAVGSTEISASAVTRDELQSAAVNNISSDSIILNSTNGTADAGDFLVLDGTDGSSSNANHRILFDETFVDKIGLFNINTLGASGTALKVNSSGSGIEFGSSGGLVLLNTTDVTSATATVTFDNTLITDTYDIYQLSYTNIDPVTDGVSLRGRLSTDNGGSFIATAYKTGYYYNKIGGSGSSQSGSSQSSYFSDTLTYGNDAGFQHGGVITFYGLRSSNHHKVLIQTQVINGTNGVPYHTAQNWYIENTNKMNHIEMSFSSGNISVGSFSFYGLAK